ncbi:MAG: rhodanese-like domain-containing protein [Ilumatobacter sp.]|uniref:rhodanese-like domain-containing protein n=1 Tax=Ilumatobacter sp. TaxID=1967498 RepID=UPI00260D65CE|nr:rhodanese-like domain-containing protein [Ilumatobacter sp.]MDJ0768421.1 rhodanese-like domain-containing protein [Ilumatobacter sp.]
MTISTPIHPSELRHLLREDPETRVLDVRTGAEFESAHIEGSFNVPLDLLAEQVRHVADVEHPVVLVCQSGGRATTAHAKLHEAGKTNLRVLEGGMGAWLAAGGDVVRGQEKWSLERQVRGVAGGIVLVSILASLVFPKLRFVAGGIGAGLTFSALTDTCTMGELLSKLHYNRGPVCNLDRVLDEMTAEAA